MVGMDIIETGVDRLVKLVKNKGRIALKDAATRLSVSASVIQEWSEYLEEEGIINIEYKLATPYLVDKKITGTDISQKKKEFGDKKDIFVRKAEATVMNLQDRGKELRKIKGQFDNLKDELGMGVSAIKGELKELENYNKMKEEMESKILEHKQNLRGKYLEMQKEIQREQLKYQNLISEIEKEELAIEDEKKATDSLEIAEENLKLKLEGFKVSISELDSKIKKEDDKIHFSRKHVDKLRKMAKNIKDEIKNNKKTYEDMLGDHNESKEDIEEIQNKILKKLENQKKDISNADAVAKKFNKFFETKMGVEEMVLKVANERDELEHQLTELVKKAKAFQLSSNKKDLDKKIFALEGKFKKVEEKKGLFEMEFKNLFSLLKKKK